MKRREFCLLQLRSLRGLVAMAAVCLSVSFVVSCSGGKIKEVKSPFRPVNLDTIAYRDSLDSITAESWLLKDSATGFIIYAKHPEKKMYPASITKMMTCILALEKGHMDDTVKITEDVYIARNSITYLNDSYIFKNLLLEMMMRSDNDAAFAIAKSVAGDTLKFYDMMNAKAKELKLDNTHFANPNGMPNKENYSSAADLMKLMEYCMKNKRFAEIVATAEADIPLTDGRHLPCKNTNHLLEEYEGCIGVKTGFTNEAGSCIAAAARRDGVTLYLVLLKCKGGHRFIEAPLVFNYGFSLMKALRGPENPKK